jgi:hypothetical protein
LAESESSGVYNSGGGRDDHDIPKAIYETLDHYKGRVGDVGIEMVCESCFMQYQFCSECGGGKYHVFNIDGCVQECTTYFLC